MYMRPWSLSFCIQRYGFSNKLNFDLLARVSAGLKSSSCMLPPPNLWNLLKKNQQLWPRMKPGRHENEAIKAVSRQVQNSSAPVIEGLMVFAMQISAMP